MLRAALIVLLALSRTSYAQEACDPKEAADLRAHLEEERHHAKVWNLTWGLIFTTTAVGTFAVGYADPFPSLQTGLYVSSAKSAVGAASRWILPLRVEVPDPNADVCADVAALRKALERTAKHERNNFWLNHIGGILVNGAGALVIWKYDDSVGKALLSVATGYPVGLLSNYLAPRNSWHRWRDRTWTIAAVPHHDGVLVLLSF